LDTLVSRNVPFVLLTGYPRETLPAQFRDKPYLGKPFRTMEAQLIQHRLSTAGFGCRFKEACQFVDPGQLVGFGIL
jgi:hypothetical protein